MLADQMIDEIKPTSEVQIRVRFAETDAMGIVHHANYLLYFEVGRVETMRQLGTSYAELEALGYSLAVSEATIRYIAPARFDQLLTVQTWAENIGSRGITFSYKIVDTCAGQDIVTGKTRLICVDHGGTVRQIPAEWRNAVRKLAAVD